MLEDPAFKSRGCRYPRFLPRGLCLEAAILGCSFVLRICTATLSYQGPSPTLHLPPEVPTMAPIGRKRKAAPAETVDKREKLAEGPAVVIEHW